MESLFCVGICKVVGMYFCTLLLSLRNIIILLNRLKTDGNMKIIATSDWHIGNMFHGIDRLKEHEHFFNWLKETVCEQKPDALLVAGDIFDNGNPSAAAHIYAHGAEIRKNY